MRGLGPFRLQRTRGLGLYVSRSWPLDIERAVSAERGRLVERLIATAREHKLRILSGLGVYSWGFGEIIQAHGHLGPTNSNALCRAFDGPHDPGYSAALAAIRVGQQRLAQHPRADMPGFQPCAADQQRLDYHAARQRIEAVNQRALAAGERVYDRAS